MCSPLSPNKQHNLCRIQEMRLEPHPHAEGEGLTDSPQKPQCEKRTRKSSVDASGCITRNILCIYPCYVQWHFFLSYFLLFLTYFHYLRPSPLPVLFVHGISSAWRVLLLLPNTDCLTLGKLLNFSVCPHLQNGDNGHTHPVQRDTSITCGLA